MPERPLKGQAFPPCGAGEHALNGGCWQAVPGARSPCPPRTAERDGKCYTPVEQPIRFALSWDFKNGSPVPDKPTPYQARPPCYEDESAINGACYFDMSCDLPHHFKHGGKCYYPVAAPPQVPQS
jgi:hypothetical protein